MIISITMAEVRTALARLLCEMYRSDLGALRYDLGVLPGFRSEEAPAPLGMRPIDYTAACVAALPDGATSDNGALWTLLRERRPGRVREIDAMCVLWRQAV